MCMIYEIQCAFQSPRRRGLQLALLPALLEDHLHPLTSNMPTALPLPEDTTFLFTVLDICLGAVTSNPDTCLVCYNRCQICSMSDGPTFPAKPQDLPPTFPSSWWCPGKPVENPLQLFPSRLFLAFAIHQEPVLWPASWCPTRLEMWLISFGFRGMEIDRAKAPINLALISAGNSMTVWPGYRRQKIVWQTLN